MLVQARSVELQVTYPSSGSTHSDCKLAVTRAGVLGGTMGSVMPSQAPEAQPAGPDRAALLLAATQAGTEISDRLLETFRAQGLIPHPCRAGYRGRAPVWRYPPGTDRQLAALIQWRRHTKDPDLLKVLLWLDGFAVPPSVVRDALARQLSGMTEFMDREISRQARRLGLDPSAGCARSQAIDALAQVLAAKRGTTPVPRRGRVRAQDRVRAVALMIRMFGLGESVRGTAEDAAVVERVLGLAPNARRHAIAEAGPWLTGPAEDLFGASGIVGLPNLLDAVNDACEADLTAARQTVVALFRHLPLMTRMLSAMFDDDNYAGMAVFGRLDQHPETVVFIVPMVIAMQKAGWRENLDTVTSALHPFPGLAEQAHRILDMPAATINANLAGKPAETRDRAQRIIDAAIEGQFGVDGKDQSTGLS
jgi:hypothetical protein